MKKGKYVAPYFRLSDREEIRIIVVSRHVVNALEFSVENYQLAQQVLVQ